MTEIISQGIDCGEIHFDHPAALAEIVHSMGITKEQGSFAVTGMFITYGVGQIISGVMGDKYSQKKLI